MYKKFLFINNFSSLVLFLVGLLVPLFFDYAFFMPFHIPKWIALYAGAVVLAATVLYKNKVFELPKLGRVLSGILVVCIAWLLMVHCYDSPHASLRLITFTAVLLTSFTLYRSKPAYFFAFFWGMVTASSVTVFTLVLRYFGLEFSMYFPAGAKFVPFFQNINMAAQFFGVCLLVQIYLFRTSTQRVARYFLVPMILAHVASIYYLHSRSIYLALALSVPFALYKKGWSRRVIYLLVLQCLVVAVYAFATFYGRESKYLHVGKERIQLALEQRLEMWQDATELIKKSPEGVGYDDYQFSILPFTAKNRHVYSREVQMARSPHNDFLSFTVAYGVPVAVASALLLLVLFCRLLRLRSLDPLGEQLKALVLAAFVFYFVEAIGQFPTDNAYSFLFIAVFIGLAGGLTYQPIMLSRVGTNILRAVAIIALLLGFILSARYTASEYIFNNYATSLDRQRIACDLWPENWRSCLRQAGMEEDLLTQRRVLLAVLDRNTFNFLALRELIGNHFQSDMTELACFGGAIYKNLFRHRSSITGYLEANCPNGIVSKEENLFTDLDDFLARSNNTLKHM